MATKVEITRNGDTHIVSYDNMTDYSKFSSWLVSDFQIFLDMVGKYKVSTIASRIGVSPYKVKCLIQATGMKVKKDKPLLDVRSIKSSGEKVIKTNLDELLNSVFRAKEDE